MTTDKASQKTEIEADDQCTHSAFSGTHLPSKEELGNCVQPKTGKTHCHALHDTAHSTVITFSEDISDATLQVPSHVLVRGLMPAPKRDTHGEFVCDNNDNVQLVPNIGGTPMSEARTVDEVVDVLQDHLSVKQGRVLRALMRAVRPLRTGQITPLARFSKTTNEVIADQTLGTLNNGQCWHRVPTSCTHIAVLSWQKFERMLNKRDADALIHTMRERGKHLDPEFDSDQTFDTDRVRQTVRDVEPITEADFEQIIDEFAAMRLLIVTETHDTRGCLLNHLTMAQTHPRQKPALARTAPNGSARTEALERDDVKATGEVKATEDSKMRERGNRAQRVRISELSSTVKRQSELFEVQEEQHAAAVARKNTEIADRDSHIAEFVALFDEMARRAHEIAGRNDLSGDEKFDALASAVAAPDHDTRAHTDDRQTRKEARR